MNLEKKCYVELSQLNLYGYNLLCLSYITASHDHYGDGLEMEVFGPLLLAFQKGKDLICIELKSKPVTIDGEVSGNILTIDAFMPASTEDYLSRCYASSIIVYHPDTQQRVVPLGEVLRFQNEEGHTVSLLIEFGGGVGMSFIVNDDTHHIQMVFKRSGLFYATAVNSLA